MSDKRTDVEIARYAIEELSRLAPGPYWTMHGCVEFRLDESSDEDLLEVCGFPGGKATDIALCISEILNALPGVLAELDKANEGSASK